MEGGVLVAALVLCNDRILTIESVIQLLTA